MSQCVFCDAITNLNTQLTVALDDGIKVTVMICDLHAEDATIKTARTAYLAKQQKATELIAQLKNLGYDVAKLDQRAGLIVPTLATPARAPAPAPTPEANGPLSGDDVVSTELLDAKSRKGMVSVGGNTDFGHVAGLPSHDVSEVAKKLGAEARKGQAKLTVVEGREGIPLVVPEKRIDGMGTTRIKVTKKENDAKLQSRFKKMARDTMDEARPHFPDFARGGYQNSQVDCPICAKTATPGTVMNGGREITCPKCNGACVIPV